MVGFNELLPFYLDRTFVSFEGEVYVEKEGICIGSRVAPVLGQIFLAQFDNIIFERLGGEEIFKIFRCLCDYLVIDLPTNKFSNAVTVDLLGTLAACAHRLNFTRERTSEGRIQFFGFKT